MKAAGGISSLADAEKFLELGASREAFSILQPPKICPSFARSAAPTQKWEYGTFFLKFCLTSHVFLAIITSVPHRKVYFNIGIFIRIRYKTSGSYFFSSNNSNRFKLRNSLTDCFKKCSTLGTVRWCIRGIFYTEAFPRLQMQKSFLSLAHPGLGQAVS